jgi:hypothetical protein
MERGTLMIMDSCKNASSAGENIEPGLFTGRMGVTVFALSVSHAQKPVLAKAGILCFVHDKDGIPVEKRFAIFAS